MCAKLVVQNIKQATAPFVWWYEHHNESMPQVGDLFIVTDWYGTAKAVIEITKIEKDNAIKAAEAVDGKLVGIDFIPAKNRKKEQPYILEVNSMPGFSGIEKIKNGLTQEILEHFKNRDNWRK